MRRGKPVPRSPFYFGNSSPTCHYARFWHPAWRCAFKACCVLCPASCPLRVTFPSPSLLPFPLPPPRHCQLLPPRLQAGAEVLFEHHVTGVRRKGAGWEVQRKDGPAEAFDAVVLTMPVPQILQLQGDVRSREYPLRNADPGAVSAAPPTAVTGLSLARCIWCTAILKKQFELLCAMAIPSGSAWIDTSSRTLVFKCLSHPSNRFHRVCLRILIHLE